MLNPKGIQKTGRVTVSYLHGWLKMLKSTGNMEVKMDVSENSGTPEIIRFNKVFHYKPSIWGYHYFRKHPYTSGQITLFHLATLFVCTGPAAAAQPSALCPIVSGDTSRLGRL